MTNTIDANTLRDWLEAQQPVVVLDVRGDEHRAQWAIPGSLHINAYEALKAGHPGALASAIFPHDRPVITVCNAGRVSQTAAAILAERGFDARSLVGGMKAWSLAWNTADIPLEEAALRRRLADSGRLVVLITKRNWLTRLMIGKWWKSNVYSKDELLREFERAGFSHVTFKPFPLSVRYLAVWGNVIEAWD